jgi:glycosyltransferase involved in cell wall biosynthesis
VSIHAVYEISPDSLAAKLIKTILSGADSVLTLSRAAYNELVSFGLDKGRLGIYRYWIDLNIFRPLDNKKELRRQLGLADIFTVLFIGRLTIIKGVKELVAVARSLSFINFIFIGNGPLEDYLRAAAKNSNIIFLGRIDNKELYKYYNTADIFCVPSQYEEGFGRVAMEAIACSVPVVASNKGGIPEALDNTVSILVEPTVNNLKRAIAELYQDKELYAKLQANCRNYAERNFSENNAQLIMKSYRIYN